MEAYSDDSMGSTLDQEILQLSNEALEMCNSEDFDERQLSAELSRHLVFTENTVMADETAMQGMRVPKTEAMTPDACMYGNKNPFQPVVYNPGISSYQDAMGANTIYTNPQFPGELPGDLNGDYRQPRSDPLSLPSNDLEIDRAPSLPVSGAGSIIAPATFQPKAQGQGEMFQEFGALDSRPPYEPKFGRFDEKDQPVPYADSHHEKWQLDMYHQVQCRPDNKPVSMETEAVGMVHTVEPDENGENPLHLLSEVRDTKTMAKVIDLVVRCGVLPQCINMQNKFKQTPLYLAVAAGNIPLASYLLDMGADPNIQGTMYVDRDTYVWRAPIHLAAMMGDLAISMLQLLLKKKSHNLDINIRAHGDKLTALHLALKNHSPPTMKCTDTIQLLVSAGADVSIREQCSSKTAIILAIETRDLMLVRTFLEMLPAGKRRTLLWEQMRSGDTCLHIAAGLSRVSSAQKVALLRLLVTNGANGSTVNHAKEHARDFARTEWDSIKTR